MPPYLAGREPEIEMFRELLKQDVILKNVVLTGLRGTGKTVLLETWKPIAISQKWLWVGTDLSESTSVSEERLVVRLLTDLSVVTSGIVLREPIASAGFAPVSKDERLGYEKLLEIYRRNTGLPSDKLKALLEFLWDRLKPHGLKGIIFAYDEAQTMADHADKEQFPLSLMLDVFQSIQKKGIPFMLVLVGLPTLFPKLVDARTFSERMFEVITLSKLDHEASKQAIVQPTAKFKEEAQFNDQSVELIIKTSAGYPYFIQFICREIYDLFLQKINIGQKPVPVPMDEITRKLDRNFFAGRWGRATDRQRELLAVIASLKDSDREFTVQEIVEQAKSRGDSFSNSHVSQMLVTLSNAGLIYKNRYGKYSFAVPLLGQFILRQAEEVNPN